MDIFVKLLEVDKPTMSGCIYKQEVVLDILLQFMSFQEKGENIVGTIEPPIDGIILSKVSHNVEYMSVMNGFLYATIRILDTPMGNVLKEHVKNSGRYTLADGVYRCEEKQEFFLSGYGALDGDVFKSFHFKTIYFNKQAEVPKEEW